MQESVQEKAKRYDVVVNEIKNLRDILLKEGVINENGIICDNFNRIFPELKEGEDERIRKNLIELFHDTVSNDEIFSDYGLDKTKVLAWLEKQGEQKPVVIIPKFRVGDIIRCTPSYKCDKTMHVTSIDERGYNVDYRHLGDDTTRGTIGFAFENDYELVESRLTESEKINLIKMIIEYFRTGVMPDLPQRVKIVTFLKSLKNRVGCKAYCTTTWKPNDAQIASLTIACDRNDRIGFDLTQLLKDLKKLKDM